TIIPVAFRHGPGLDQCVVAPFARGNLTRGIAHHTLTLTFAGLEMALVDIAIGIGGGAVAIDFSGSPAAFIDKPVGRGQLAPPLSQASHETAGINGAVGIGRLPLAMTLPVL